MHKGTFERLRRLMAKTFGERPQYCQIRRTFEIQNPSALLSLEVLLKPDVREGLAYLIFSAFHSVRSADERDNQILPRGFVQ